MALKKKLVFIDSTEAQVREFLEKSTDPTKLPRFPLLSMLLAYYRGTQYEAYKYDWTGRVLSDQRMPGTIGEPSVSAHAGVVPTDTGTMQGYYPLLAQRKPSIQEHIPAEIVDGFSSYLFGHNKFPKINVVMMTPEEKNEGESGENLSEGLEKHFSDLIADIGLPMKLSVARPIAGAAGSVVFVLGKKTPVRDEKGVESVSLPAIDIYEPQHCVPLWADKRNKILAAIEIRFVIRTEQIPKQDKDGKNIGTEPCPVWERRVISTTTDITYQSKGGVRYEKEEDIVWEIKGSPITHGLGYVPVVWVDNFPDISGRDDGIPDYDETDFTEFDEVNRIKSALSRTVIGNLDPTLVVKISPKILQEGGGVVKRGPDTAIIVGEGGDAFLLEITGASIKAAIEWKDDIKRSIFNRRKYVSLKPEDIKGQDLSGAAMVKLLQAMFSRVDVLRAMWSLAIIRILEMVWDMEGQERRPEGISEDSFKLALKWGPYAEPSIGDMKLAADIVVALMGGEKVFTRELAAEFLAPHLQMDPARILKALKEAEEEQLDQEQELPE